MQLFAGEPRRLHLPRLVERAGCDCHVVKMLHLYFIAAFPFWGIVKRGSYVSKNKKMYIIVILKKEVVMHLSARRYYVRQFN